MRARVAAGCAMAIAAVAPAAHADDAAGGMGFILYSVGIFIPGEIGLDRAVASNAEARLRLGWVYQIPLGLFHRQSDSDWLSEASPLWRHRVVVSVAFSYGIEGQGEDRGLHLATADLRGGYRYRFLHRNGIAPYLGLGFGGQGGQTADWRAYLSPELGIHFGRDVAFFPGVQLGLQGDVFFDGSPARIVGVAAWTLW